MTLIREVRDRAAAVRRAYAPHEHRPLDGYLVAMGAFGVLGVGIGAAAKLLGRTPPERPAMSDVLLISVATHKLSRLVAKDAVTSPLRAPVVRYSGPAGAA